MNGPIVVYRTLPAGGEPNLWWHRTWQVHRTLRCAERRARIGTCVVRALVDPGLIPPWRLCSYCFAEYREYSYDLLYEARPLGSGPSRGPDPVFEMLDVAWDLEHRPDQLEVVECGVAVRVGEGAP